MSAMLFGVIDILFAVRLASLLLKPWCTMIKRGDTTQPAVVPSEPSEPRLTSNSMALF